ncbi:Frataxin [Gautieria morchelliformis]|nr:Frataxin [Gautieria morchelliformis]
MQPYLSHSVRRLATPPPMLASSDMSIENYHAVSDDTMDSLLEYLEALIDSVNDRRYEVEYSSGVLTLILGDKGTYVINKQPPNKQIWLSSPLSGPKRYDFSQTRGAWYYSRDGKTLGSFLKEELETLLNRPIHLELP